MRSFVACLCSLTLLALLIISAPSHVAAESGDQTINGTRVHTEIDHERGVATFGGYLDCGRTERRRVRVVGFNHIGKEANNLERQFFFGIEERERIEYGGSNQARFQDRLQELCEKLGERTVTLRAGVARMSLRKARHNIAGVSKRLKHRLSKL